MNKNAWRKLTRLGLLMIGVFLLLPGPGAEATHTTFAPGDLFISIMEPPQVQWRHPDGSLNRILVSTVPGVNGDMGIDASRNLYVSHMCNDPTCTTGNTVERFNTSGVSQGSVGSGYNCNPNKIVFDAAGTAYVGQADCTGHLLRLAIGLAPTEFAVAPENRGSLWIDLASDGCTVFYTSAGPNVRRFNVCTNTQLSNFNAAPLPGGATNALRILPDGGVLVVAPAAGIVRLDATGALVRIYDVPSEPRTWIGVDTVGDGTFWATNWTSSNVYRFDLATGTVLASFNTGTPLNTVVGVAVQRSSCP